MFVIGSVFWKVLLLNLTNGDLLNCDKRRSLDFGYTGRTITQMIRGLEPSINWALLSKVASKTKCTSWLPKNLSVSVYQVTHFRRSMSDIIRSCFLRETTSKMGRTKIQKINWPKLRSSILVLICSLGAAWPLLCSGLDRATFGKYVTGAKMMGYLDRTKNLNSLIVLNRTHNQHSTYQNSGPVASKVTCCHTLRISSIN